VRPIPRHRGDYVAGAPAARRKARCHPCGLREGGDRRGPTRRGPIGRIRRRRASVRASAGRRLAAATARPPSPAADQPPRRDGTGRSRGVDVAIISLGLPGENARHERAAICYARKRVMCTQCGETTTIKDALTRGRRGSGSKCIPPGRRSCVSSENKGGEKVHASRVACVTAIRFNERAPLCTATPRRECEKVDTSTGDGGTEGRGGTGGKFAR